MEITEIKSKLSLHTVLSQYNLNRDRNNRLCCPWHKDKTPSLQIYPKTNTWTCFSSNCNAGSGDQIDFIMKYEKVTKHEAILKAKSMLIGIDSELIKPSNKTNTMKSVPEISRIAILTKYYQATLGAMPRSTKAMEYAQSRNLNYGKLGIGYSGADIGKAWNKTLQISAAQIGVLRKSHVDNAKGERGYRPKIKYCLMFAMKNRSGKIIDMYGRSIMNKPNTKHFYMSGKQQGLYPKYPKSETTKLILTESIIDAASLIQDSQITNEFSILALYGTNGFTEEHSQAIKELELLQEVIFFFDGDQAGQKAIINWTTEIKKINEKSCAERSRSMKFTYVNTPKGEDVNSLLQGHNPEILQHLLKDRKPVNNESDLFFSTDDRTTSEGVKYLGELAAANSVREETAKADGRLLNQLDTSNNELLIYTTTDLKVTILGGIRITGLDRMKVTVKIESRTNPHQLIRHSLDLYHAKQVDHLCEIIASQLEIRSSKAGSIMSKMTTALEEYRQGRLEAMKPKAPQLYQMSQREKEAAIKYLKDPLLMIKTARAIKQSGIVGEEKNAMIGYVVYLSRKREKSLHVMYLGASGSGKTHVQEGLASLTPAEDKIEATGLSDQALYYEGMKLKGKILFIEDIDGAENIMYIIRELQSKGKIIKRVAWRDNKGNTQTIEVVAEGPVVISSCTTQEKVYEDNANRCILLYIDQSKEQDKRVMDYIKNKSTGTIKECEQDQIRKQIQNVQRMLRPIKVYNPYANFIDLPSEIFKPRRSLPLLLGFIETVTFYHQYQREVKTDNQGQRYIESTYEDIEVSFDLLKDVLFNKSDELTNAAREFLEMLKTKVEKGDTFYTKKIRKDIRMNASNLKRYMIELQRYDYIKIKNGSRYRGYEYQITDYGEYEDLKSSIDKRLEDILLRINELSGSVVHSGSKGEMNHLSPIESVS